MTWIVISSAGALSGAGQAFGQGMLNPQSGFIQQGLMEERMKHELEMEWLRQEHERKMLEKRADEERQRREAYERQRAERRYQNAVWPENRRVADVTPEEGALDLTQLRPNWREIVGSPDTNGVISDTAYRRWLANQPKAYQRRMLESTDAAELNESIGEFLNAR
jgi:hypothetical protein